MNEEGVSRRLIRGAMWNMLLIFIFAALFLPSLVIGIQTHQPSGAVASRWRRARTSLAARRYARTRARPPPALRFCSHHDRPTLHSSTRAPAAAT